ncbi:MULTISPECIES: type II secretion system protein [Acinetobacter]|uniref:Type II secretion system protein n=1 Tax=Acinetobacter pecorum TaxID=2762215 RepID=A0ABR8VUU1_9GAMM|nr:MULTISPECIES: type II secretion system protein [Acinetobacter]MBD8008539.1 type II secretion system protein [Acinetobacter pecorum]OAL77126.1 type II secretion system protein GspH [Acinetobacter sp. SFA]
MIRSPHSAVRGFTLIELMVVIVIMGIMASLVLLNTSGVDQRKAMQAREILLMDLQRVLREANDQSRILALDVQTATDVTPFRYAIIEYRSTVQSGQNLQNEKWQSYADFKLRSLPDHVSFQIQSLEQQRFANAKNRDLTQANSPQLIWLGNGEVKPVRIQFFFEEREIGAAIEVDHLGKINEI